MDEPSEGLAPVMVEHLEGIIAQLRAAGLAILLVEQNLYSALTVADEVYILETGKIAWKGLPGELQGNRGTLERLLGVK
jgi:branched-chain amino acid transport system ATP-binding protein